MRRLLLTLTVAVASVALAQPASAQIPLKFGIQGAVQTSLDEITSGPDLNNSFGLGARVALQPPVLPVGVVAQGVYYFPDCGGFDCSYMTYSLAAQLRLPLPMISPYAIAGWQWRRAGFEGDSNTENGFMAGAGVQLDLGVALFLEGTFEMGNPEVPDFDNSPIVVKGGILIG